MSQKPDSDATFVARTQNGDVTAFDALVKKYTPKLYGMVYNMTANKEDTHDLLQDIFTKAFTSLENFRGQSSFYTWIYTIATNKTLNFLKKRNRRITYSLDDVESGIQNDPIFIDDTHYANPLRQLNIQQLQKKLNEALQKLSKNHRAVVTLFDIQGLSHSQIAKILNVSEGTVRSRLHYAHRQLRKLLSEFFLA